MRFVKFYRRMHIDRFRVLLFNLLNAERFLLQEAGENPTQPRYGVELFQARYCYSIEVSSWAEA